MQTRVLLLPAVIALSASAIAACESDAASSSSSGASSGDGGDASPMTSSDAGAPSSPTCEMPRALFEHCGMVPSCGALITPTFDPSPLPVGTSTTLPPGTYALTASVHHMSSASSFAPSTQTTRYGAGGELELIVGTVTGGAPFYARESGTYSIAGGKLIPSFTCAPPADGGAEYVTFTVDGDTLQIFAPLGSDGAGLHSTFVRFAP